MQTTTSGKTKINLFVSDDRYEQLRRDAFERRTTITDLVNAALDATYGALATVDKSDQGAA